MIKLSPKTLWLAIPLLVLAACSRGAGGAWGTRDTGTSWSTYLTDDPATRIPGLAEGAITKIDLLMGDKGVIRIALWSTGGSHGCSSGGGPATGGYMEGHVEVDSTEPVPFSFTSSDGVRAQGSIGDQEYTVEKSGLFLLRSGADGVLVEQVDVPGEALDSFDLSEQALREAFAAQWGVDEFFKAASGR